MGISYCIAHQIISRGKFADISLLTSAMSSSLILAPRHKPRRDLRGLGFIFSSCLISGYIVQSYYCLGFLSSLLGSKERASDFIDKTFQDFNWTNCSAWSTGYRWLFLGRAYMNLFDIKKSYDMFTICLAYSVERYYPQVKANALTGLAGVSRIQNNWDQTISYHRESIDILGTIGAKCDLAEAYFQFGLTYQAMRKPDQAEECKAEALKIFQNIKAPKQCDRVNKAFE